MDAKLVPLKWNDNELALKSDYDTLKSELSAKDEEIERLQKYVIAGHEQINSELKIKIKNLLCSVHQIMQGWQHDESWSDFDQKIITEIEVFINQLSTPKSQEGT